MKNKQKFAYIQDLDSSRDVVKRMVNKNSRIKTIYSLLRNQSKLNMIGDYPMISWIAKEVNKKFCVCPLDIARALNSATDGEFKNIHSDNDLIKGIYAQFKS